MSFETFYCVDRPYMHTRAVRKYSILNMSFKTFYFLDTQYMYTRAVWKQTLN
jgi:hypothetical protein